MRISTTIQPILLFVAVVSILMGSCSQREGAFIKDDEKGVTGEVSALNEDAGEYGNPNIDLLSISIPDKMELWTGETKLRGANIFQRKVYPELDGPEFMGTGYMGPPYVQADFDKLAALGANLVIISHSGLFDVKPPYGLDRKIQAHLDRLLSMIAQADMFAVIAFRTGPGRSAFTFHLDEVGDWFDKSYLDDSLWEKEEIQEAWVKMWRHTAERYATHSIVVGYLLMVEPNANEVFFRIDEPDEFYPTYAQTCYDWNRLYPHLVEAIREVDEDTPIIVGGMGYSSIDWLPHLVPTNDRRTVYTVHQYAPILYTHQTHRLKVAYPGVYDVNWDGEKDQFNKQWMDDLFMILDEFKAKYKVPVAITEFGLMRWEPGAAQFMNDQMSLFEKRGMNHALWAWDPSWEPWTEEVDAFNFRHGPDRRNHSDVSESDLLSVIQKHWQKNNLRPSSFREENGE